MIWFMIAFLFIGFAPLIFGENGELLVKWVGIGLVLVFFTMCALSDNKGGSRYDYEDDGRGNCPVYVPGGC